MDNILEIIDEFEKDASDKFKAIDLFKRKNDVLKKQRDLLFPKLISGQISLEVV